MRDEIVDKIYCINLPESLERWKRVSTSFDKLGLSHKLNRIDAVKPPKNYYFPNQLKNTQMGCTLSHMKALGISFGESRGNVMIIEDDVSPSENCIEVVENVIESLPKTWSVCYFGGQPRTPLNLYKNVRNHNIYHAKGIIGAYAYAVNYNYIKSLFDYIIKSLVSESTHSGIYDYILLEYTNLTNSFITYPLAFKPFPAVSTITGKDYSQQELDNLIEYRWKWVK